MLKYIGEKWNSIHYICLKCQATFKVKIVYTSNTVDTDECLFCACFDKIPTPKLSGEELDKKKKEIKERLK